MYLIETKQIDTYAWLCSVEIFQIFVTEQELLISTSRTNLRSAYRKPFQVLLPLLLLQPMIYFVENPV